MRNLILSTSTIAALAITAAANAVTVQMFDHTGTNANSLFLIAYNSVPKTVTATPYNVKIDGSPIVGYCVDLDHQAATNQTYPANALSAIGTYGAMGGKLGYIYNTYHTPAIDLDHQIAVQVALWEVRYDATYNLDAGAFKQISLNSTVKGYAQAILNDLSANPTFSNEAIIYRATDGQKQDIIGPVPEPASLAVLGVGALAMLRRRRSKK
ncbi:MAG: PEP-CTERM sorting domain-containing protein [Fimbriimonadaceae bacterium]|nr:PEP-CTERM sorting domain-containing protein [Fimbriimonadaceae bacterium]